MKKLVHKIVSGKTVDEFNATVNEHVRIGWTKTEASFADGAAFHASMSAEVDRILLPIAPHLRGAIVDAAAKHYSKLLADLVVRLQTSETAVPRVLDAGTLIKSVDISDCSRFLYNNGMLLDLARIESVDGVRELAVIRVVENGCRDKGKHDSFSAYQI